MTQFPSMSDRPDVNPLDIHLRAAQAKDEAFLRSVHNAGRAWEFAALRGKVEEGVLETVLEQQYSAQHDIYFNSFTLAKYALVEWCGRPIGRLYADFRDAEIRLLDLNILPAYRGRRIGEIVLRGLCGQAAATHVPVTLQVHPFNRARQLYKRLGFKELGTSTRPGAGQGTFIEMEWRDQLSKTRNR